MKKKLIFSILITALILISLKSCQNQQPIQTYIIPKETFKTVSTLRTETKKTTTVHWANIKTWTKESVTGMRKGSYLLENKKGKISVSIISLPGQVGSLLQNINRWRNQLKLAPISENEITTQLSYITINEKKSPKIAIENPQTKTSSVIVIYQDQSENKWFFKISGDSKLVKEETQNFNTLLKSINEK